MKILHVSHNFYPATGGVEKNMEDICRGLIELGHKSDVCCLLVAGSKKYLRYRGINIYRVPYVDAKFYKIAPGIAQIVKDYDIIHVHGLGFHSDFLGITKPFHKKSIVLSTHGGVFHTKTGSIFKKAYFHIWSRLILRFYDKVVAVSKSDKSLFSKIRNNIEMIPNSIEFEKLSSIDRKPEKNLLISIGRLSKNKRNDNLIRTVAELNKRGHDTTLVIIGQDWDNQKIYLEKLAGELGIKQKVIFTGRIIDKVKMDYYKRAGFFVSASEYEGFGISVLEAMGAGIPVIVNGIDAFRTFVCDEENGFIVNFSNPTKAASHILKITKRRDIRKISANAKSTAKQYDYKSNAKRFESLYQDIASTSSYTL